jgi:hypothetical protein
MCQSVLNNFFHAKPHGLPRRKGINPLRFIFLHKIYCCIFSTMKKYAALIFIVTPLILFGNVLIAQQVKLAKIKDSSLSRLINNVQSFHQYTTKDLAISVIEIANPSGSANMPGTDEITTNLYLGVSEFGEHPEQSLFCIRNLYAVSNIQQDKKIPEEAVISFNYIDTSNRAKPVKKTVKIKLTLQTATIIK